MTGQLDEALTALLESAVPGVFGGTPPRVSVRAIAGDFVLDASSQDAQASEPRPDDRTDQLPFDGGAPGGPYLLTQSPDTGARRVWLTTDLGDRIALTASEVAFDPVEPRRVTLRLRPERDLAGVTGVRVLYGVTAVFARLKVTQSMVVALQGDDATVLDRAEALAVAVIALNRPQLVAAGNETLREADYGAEIEIKTLHITKGGSPGANVRRLELVAEIELKATRALADGEGARILRIRGHGSTAGPARPVDVEIDVEA